MSVQEELRALLDMALMQGRIEALVACTNTVGGFIDLVENGDIGDDWLDQLRVIRNGMSDIALQAEFENSERMNRATGT